MKKNFALVAVLTFLIPRFDVPLGFYNSEGFELVIFTMLVPIILLVKKIDYKFLIVFVAIFFGGIINIFLGNNDSHFFLAFSGMFSAYLFYYFSLKYTKFDCELIIKYYLAGIFIISIFGLIQFVSFQIGFRPGYDFSWFLPNHRISDTRINATFGEPSEVGQVFAPAFFLCLCRILRIKPYFISLGRALPICLVYVLSQSSLAVIGIFVCLCLLSIQYFSMRRIFYLILFIPFMFWGFYNNVENLKSKLDSAYKVVILGSIVADHNEIGGSFFTLYDHFQAAKRNFIEHPILGTGIGSHHIAYFRYGLVYNDSNFHIYNDLNIHDAASLFSRVMSEMGFIGLSFLLIFIIKNFVKRDPTEDNKMWILNSACLVILLVSFVRKGHYFAGGLPLFILMFYYIGKEYRQKRKTVESSKYY